MAKAPTQETLSPLERIRLLEEQKQAIMAEAKEGALATAEAAVHALNELGFHYELREATLPHGARQIVSVGEGRKGTRTVNAERPCPICGFRTLPPHDARAHRSQDTKKPFTAEELSGKGMKKA